MNELWFRGSVSLKKKCPVWKCPSFSPFARKASRQILFDLPPAMASYPSCSSGVNGTGAIRIPRSVHAFLQSLITAKIISSDTNRNHTLNVYKIRSNIQIYTMYMELWLTILCFSSPPVRPDALIDSPPESYESNITALRGVNCRAAA